MNIQKVSLNDFSNTYVHAISHVLCPKFKSDCFGLSVRLSLTLIMPATFDIYSVWLWFVFHLGHEDDPGNDFTI